MEIFFLHSRLEAPGRTRAPDHIWKTRVCGDVCETCTVHPLCKDRAARPVLAAGGSTYLVKRRARGVASGAAWPGTARRPRPAMGTAATHPLMRGIACATGVHLEPPGFQMKAMPDRARGHAGRSDWPPTEKSQHRKASE